MSRENENRVDGPDDASRPAGTHGLEHGLLPDDAAACFRSAFDDAATGMAIATSRGKLLYVNDAYSAMLGYAPAEMVGRHYAEITHPDDIDANVALTEDVAAGRRSSYQLTKRYIRKNGEIVWVFVTVALTRGAHGSARYLITQVQDVTEQLRSETELREERDFVTTLLQTQPTLVVTLDRDGRFTRFNRAAEEFTGYTFEEVRGQHFADLFIEPSERERVKAVIAGVWAGDFPNDNENHWVHRDGTKRLLAFKNTAMLDEDGEVEYIVASALDITERQRAQDAIRERDARLRLAVDVALMGTFELNPHTGEVIVETTERLAPLWGLGPGRVELPFAELRQLMHPDDRDAVAESLRRAAEKREDFRVEYRWLLPDGETRWRESVGTVLSDDEGEVDRIIGVSQDVTERKRGEEALRESERRHRLLVESLSDVVLRVTRDGTHREVSGSSLGRFPVRARPGDNVRDLLPATLARQRIDAIGDALDTGSPVSYTYRATVDEGVSERVATVVPWQDDEAIVIVRDITEQREAEEALQRDRILEAVSEAAACLLEAASLEESIGEALALLGEATGASRLYVYENAPPTGGARQPSRHFVWAAAPALSETPDVAQERAAAFAAGLAELAAPLAAGEPVQRQAVELPPILRRSWAEPRGARSCMLVPIFAASTWWGIVGLDDCTHPRVWSPAELDAIRVAAGVLGSAVHRELTEEALSQSEERFRQAQKLEAVGRLAGGVAHDFNNILTAITGYCERLERRATEADRVAVNEIQKATGRAALLTRQLLTFSRRQILQPRVIELNDVVEEMEDMIRRLIGSDIELITSLDPAPWRLRADPGQLQQVVMNLVVNARDAMPDGGTLTLETANVQLTRTEGERAGGLEAGDYVALVVTDSGVGIDRELHAHIFEPFFTTKAADRGTGLGLATVYGIVTQAGGGIVVESDRGRGATFKALLPRLKGASPQESAERPPDTKQLAPLTVLLVEDEEIVRDVLTEQLERRGHAVLAAASGAEALALLSRQGSPIDVLVSDVEMPSMGGRELAGHVRDLYPDVKVLLVSGHTEDESFRSGSDLPEAFLQKPFGWNELARSLHELLAA